MKHKSHNQLATKTEFNELYEELRDLHYDLSTIENIEGHLPARAPIASPETSV